MMFSASDLITLASGGRQLAMDSCTCRGYTVSTMCHTTHRMTRDHTSKDTTCCEGVSRLDNSK